MAGTVWQHPPSAHVDTTGMPGDGFDSAHSHIATFSLSFLIYFSSYVLRFTTTQTLKHGQFGRIFVSGSLAILHTKSMAILAVFFVSALLMATTRHDVPGMATQPQNTPAQCRRQQRNVPTQNMGAETH